MREQEKILKVLRERNGWSFGLEILEANTSIHRSSLYINLASLQERGFVDSMNVPAASPGHLPRIKYKITDSGRGKLITLERVSVGRADVVPQLS